MGFYNNVMVKKLRVMETYQAFPGRIRVSGFFYEMQKAWPFACAVIMTVVNLVCVWLCSTLTTLLYNGAVADKWNRAHLMIKQQRQYFDQIFMQQVQEKSRGSAVADHAIDVNGSSSKAAGVERLDHIPVEVMEHIEEMQKKMNMMQMTMRRNMELMLKSRSNVGVSFLTNSAPGMSYAEIKAEMEVKTKALASAQTEKEKGAINIELEKLFLLLENTREYKDEKLIEQQEKRAKNEPIDRKCLENMRVKYGEQNLRNRPDLAERVKTIPTLKLITMDPIEIVKKHADDWKFLTLGGLNADEMRAIRANLPQFARNQLRQLAWCQRLDDMIDKLENANDSPKPKPRPTTRRITFKPGTANVYENKNSLIDEIKNGRRPHS